MKNGLLTIVKVALFYSMIGLTMLGGFNASLAASYSSQEYKSVKEVFIDVHFENASLKEVFLTLESKTGFTFGFDERQLDKNVRIDLVARNQSLESVLVEISKRTSLHFRQVNNDIDVKLEKKQQKTPEVEVIQTRTVSGKVLSFEDNSGLPGVNIIEKGTSNGTVTDVEGRYSLEVSEGAVLIFSSVGFTTEEIEVGGRSVIDLTMVADIQSLEEIVVVGYGTMKKRDVNGAVASVSGDEIAAVPVANVAQALTGRLPGVNVITQDGRPDAEISIRVRGGGSISQSNEPLFIVDGFPVSSISDIPASQIQSIDVLKDASSTAIYGARGANGVIIVTTKSGEAGKFTVSYDGYAKFNQPAKYLNTMSAYDYIAYNWGYAQAISDGYAEAWEMLWGIGDYEEDYNNPAGIDHYRNVGAKNFSKEAYGSSFSQSHNLSISNGNDKTKYLLSLNHVDEDGMKVNSWYKRTNVSFKIDQELVEPLQLSLDVRYADVNKVGDEGTTNGRGSLLSSAYWFRPIATEDVLGELNDSENTQLGMYDYIMQDVYNPVARMKDFTPQVRARSIHANSALSWNITNGLTARTELGLITRWGRNKTWSGAVYNNYFDSEGNITYSGNAKIRSSEGWNLRWANTLTYDVQGLGDAHRLSVLAGQEISNSGSEYTEIWGNYYPASFSSERAFAMMDQYLTSTSSVNHGYSSSSSAPNRLMSYFGRLNYSLLDKYQFTATFRADGSSRFAPAKQWGYFPAVALGWRLSDESFLQNAGWIYNLKLRAAYGTVGNDGINAEQWLMRWESGGPTRYSINEQQQVSYVPDERLANPNLKWETTVTRNIGIDYGLFDNRVFGSIDAYWNSTRDLLMLRSISEISGFSTTFDNVGSTSNKGIEVAIGADIIRSTDFNLTANLNLNINKGNVDDLADGVNGLYKTQWGSSMTQPNTGDYILVEGRPVGLVRGYVYEGWYDVDDFDYAGGVYTLKEGVADIGSGIIGTVYGTTANKPGGQVAYPGVIKYKDISGPDGTPDGIVDEHDVTIIGDMTPKHTGGFNISGNFKAIDFRLDFNWSYGNEIYNANYLAAFYGSKEDGLYKNRLDYLTSSYRIHDIRDGQLVSVTDPAELRALNANVTTFLPYHENPVASTLGIEDGSYLRLNTVTLGYTLPETLVNRVGVSNLRIYGSIYNAFVLTGYSGLDPEVNTNTNQGGAEYPTLGLDWGSYPRARSFVLGLNVNF